MKKYGEKTIQQKTYKHLHMPHEKSIPHYGLVASIKAGHIASATAKVNTVV